MKSLLNKAQQQASDEITKRLQQYGIACLWGEARAGKSRAFLNATKGYRTLVITEKSAISGVLSEAKEIGVEVDCINYQSIHKMNPDDYQLIVCDEAHRFIAKPTPKPSVTWKEVVKFTKGKFLILASATPTAEGYGGMYYQLGLSSWSPFKFPRFTKFFEEYGIPSKIYTGTREVPSYKKTKVDKIKRDMQHLVVTLTRKDTGHKHESKDVLHRVGMKKWQKKIEKRLKKTLLYVKDDYEILANTPVKLLGKLHQLAGGIGIKAEPESKPNPNFIKLKKKIVKKMSEKERDEYEESKYIFTPKTLMFEKTPPKVNYIRENFDVENTIILSYYKHEQEYLSKIFPHTGSVTKLSTGVDLSHYKTMVIYSMGFSSANYFQVKARLMNVKRKTKMSVHYLLSGIDEYVLEAVKAKENFTSSWFKKNVNKK